MLIWPSNQKEMDPVRNHFKEMSNDDQAAEAFKDISNGH